MGSVRLCQEQVRTLYEQHGPVLLAYGISLLHDRSASEDVLHQVFVKLLQTDVAINGQPLHYLYRAIRNTAFNYRRNHSRELELASNGHWRKAHEGWRRSDWRSSQRCESCRGATRNHRPAHLGPDDV